MSTATTITVRAVPVGEHFHAGYDLLFLPGLLPRVGDVLATPDDKDWIVDLIVWAADLGDVTAPSLRLRPRS